MELTRPQLDLLERLQSALDGQAAQEFTYETEYLGYLPYGQYHWLAAAGQHLPGEILEFSDLEALEKAGYLLRVSEWRNPEDDTHSRITFVLRSDDADVRKSV
ncbi:hypothetical protein [Gimesia chilikensis]|nr:hypothetical protein [Gimesia chilikensis]